MSITPSPWPLKIRSKLDGADHTRVVLSQLVEAGRSPRCEKVSARPRPSCPRNSFGLPVARSQTLMVSSQPAEANDRRSGENETIETVAWCPRRTCFSASSRVDQTRTVLSALADANSAPSDESAMSLIAPSWPQTALTLPLDKDQTCTIAPSASKKNSVPPSGENSIFATG